MSESLEGHANTGGEAVRLLVATTHRWAAAASELGVSERLRLSDWQRSTLRSLLFALIQAVEDELRAG